jgi:O-antigen/teichoic acid export membrane protein
MSHKRKILKGSVSNILRTLLSTLIALVLPPFLVHHLPPAAYSAWVLILQLSAYMNLLDFGLQTAIGKFVAEHDATGNQQTNHRLISTSFTILGFTALIGAILVVVMAWQVPRLFHQMPVALLSDVRLGLLVVGLSTAFALPFNTFVATFTGLQQYTFPTIVAGSSQIAAAAGLIVLVLMHGSLVQLAFVMAGANIAAAAAQFLGWQSYARARVPFSFPYFDRESAVRLLRFGGSLAIWTVAALFISGLDTVIIGHYNYENTGFYAIASTATNFMLLVISSVFNPLIPAVSSIQSSASPDQIGEIAIKATRYCALLLCLIGLPVILGAYPLLSIWVGHAYATRSTPYLELLVLGNMVRQLGYPYALVVVATGRQYLTTLPAIAEAAANFAFSIFLVQKIGAIGVAMGTLIGAFVTLVLHLVVSMAYTRSTISIRRPRFLLHALVRPLLITVPSLLLYPFWRRSNMLPFTPMLLGIWFVTTFIILWKTGLTADERRRFKTAWFHLLYWRSGRA